MKQREKGVKVKVGVLIKASRSGSVAREILIPFASGKSVQYTALLAYLQAFGILPIITQTRKRVACTPFELSSNCNV